LEERMGAIMKTAPSWLLAEFVRSFRRLRAAASVVAVPLAGTLVVSTPTSSLADEGGVSFWVPGFISSLAATPLVPGFSFANVVYYSNVSAGGDVAFAKQVPLGNTSM